MQIGIIEGFYGKAWQWKARFGYADFLRRIDFDFYIYAPKEDEYLRENWKEPFTEDKAGKLNDLSKIFREKGVKWGIGLSPFKAYISFDDSVKSRMRKKLDEIASLNPDIISVLFDDMRGDTENIAAVQVEIVHFIRKHVPSVRILFCPTYYSFDPLLDSFFGKRPGGYLKYIGDNLDTGVDIIWTGPRVRSESIDTEHLKKVREILKRKPFIWDNYIANDGEKHKKFLYIKPFKNRDRDILKHISGYMVNPMNQAYLSKIPILTIKDELISEYRYDPEYSVGEAVKKVCGSRYSDKMLKYTGDFLSGIDNIPESRKKEMLEYFSSIEEDWAYEVVDWLAGSF
ncbi:MAG: hyaluronidase [Spirochaetes bacterium]|nr:hyaluronidase [Spirochaetota bacterium]